MWFDEIMDDCKQALKTSNENKGIFAPIFVNLVLVILLAIFLIINTIFLFGDVIKAIIRDVKAYEIFATNLPSIIIIGVITYLLVVVGISLMKAGSINLYQKAVNNINLQISDFFDGIKQSFFKLFKGTLFIHLIILLISPIVLGLFILYSVTIGFLTGGWGVLFLSSFVAVFFAAWPIITVVDNIRPLKAILLGFKLGKQYLPALFILMIANIMIGNYLVTVLGPFGAIIAGWFINGVVGTYFSVVILLVYNRKKQSLLDG